MDWTYSFATRHHPLMRVEESLLLRPLTSPRFSRKVLIRRGKASVVELRIHTLLDRDEDEAAQHCQR